MAVKFVKELPQAKRGGRSNVWGEILEELEKSPGKWALVREGKPEILSSTAHYIKARYGVEAVTRTVNGTCGLYVRVKTSKRRTRKAG